MKRRVALTLLVSMALVISSVVIAQDSGSSGTTAGERNPPEPPRTRARLVKPWSDLTTLSDEQKQQIIAIHADAVARMNAIRKQEEADIMALLTPQNKAELEALKEKQRADQKARRAQQRQQPSPSGDDDADEKGEGHDKDR